MNSLRTALLQHRWIGLVAFAVLLTHGNCQAQEFRIYTRLYDHAADAESPPFIGCSVSMFHAGKVYDKTGSEVIIFEPALRQFTIIDGARMLATTVTFDQILHFLKLAENEAQQYVAHLRIKPGTKQAVEVLEFQLSPKFQANLDSGQRKLTLQSPAFRYDIQCGQDTKSAEVLNVYLRYADWIARLNSVMNPQSFFPAPRIALNKTLRNRGLLPLKVELQVRSNPPFHVHAEHTIHWNLDRKDRSDIHHWETMLRSKDVKYVTFGEYRQTVLVSQSKR